MIVKIPRWDLTKFVGVDREIGSSMKSVGEIMSIGKSFEEIMQKGLRMIGQGMHGFVGNNDIHFDDLDNALTHPTDLRVFAIAQALEEGYTIDRIEELTKIDKWFIERLNNIVTYAAKLKEYDKIEDLPREVLHEAKRLGFSDFQIARLVENPEGTMESEVLRVRALTASRLEVLPKCTSHQHRRFGISRPHQLPLCHLWCRGKLHTLRPQRRQQHRGARLGCLPHR